MTLTAEPTTNKAGHAPARTKRQDMRFVRRVLILGYLVLALAIGGTFWAVIRLGSDPSDAAAATIPSVAVTLKDFAISSAVPTVAAGQVDFAVQNAGPQPHEFLVFQTDLASDQLPLGDDGRVSEDADNATRVFDSGDNIDVGTTKTFHAALTAGNYVLICNLAGGHYTKGMRTKFTVTASPTPPTAVAATLKDFGVSLGAPTVKAGLVDFTVRNDGPQPHEYLIFQTDVAADALPLGDDGRVNEDADGATKVFDSGDNIDVGTSKTFSAALTPGNYVVICNLPGHYTKGMRTPLVVTG
jgi:uncharacterized cupredoxin-like copper-binding protein